MRWDSSGTTTNSTVPFSLLCQENGTVEFVVVPDESHLITIHDIKTGPPDSVWNVRICLDGACVGEFQTCFLDGTDKTRGQQPCIRCDPSQDLLALSQTR